MVKDFESHLQLIISAQLLSPNTMNKAIDTLADDEEIEREIAAILAIEEDPEDENDHLLNDIFSEAAHVNDYDDDDGLTAQQVQANENLLIVFQDNMNDSHGLNVMWDVSGVNCAAHTLQLAIEDTFKSVTNKTQNTIKLSNRAAKFIRKQSTMCMLKEANIIFTKPEIDVVTRWGSTFQMVTYL